MDEYDDKFPFALGNEEKTALTWKIERDYRESNMGAIAFKDEYLAFAINFYTRNQQSLENIVALYRMHKQDERRRNLADIFLTDMKSRLRTRELAHN
jgi:hypothetical protein